MLLTCRTDRDRLASAAIREVEDALPSEGVEPSMVPAEVTVRRVLVVVLESRRRIYARRHAALAPDAVLDAALPVGRRDLEDRPVLEVAAWVNVDFATVKTIKNPTRRY